MVVVRLSTGRIASPRSPPKADREVLRALKDSIRSLEPDLGGAIPFGIAPIDQALGGGLARAALHEVAASGESAMPAATQFVLGLASRARAEEPRAVVWIAEDMGHIENGAPYGPGLDEFGLAPERLVTVAAAKPRDVLWAMEEALHCRAVVTVIGEIRSARVDLVAARRLSLAAGHRDVCAFLLRTAPATDASAAATRWIIAGVLSRATATGPGPPRLSVQLTRNRRGPVGSWIVEWNCVERRFHLAPSVSQPVADAARDRPHRAAALGA
jgi:protein ImuA